MCKRLIHLSSFLLVLGFVSNASAQPADGQIRQAWAPPVIDGQIDSVWYGAFAYPIDQVVAGDASSIQNELDFSASWKALWDSRRIYFLVDVNDADLLFDSPGTGAWQSMHNDDAVELYIDADHSKGGTYAADDFQYGFRWNDPTTVGTGGNSNTDTTGVEFVIVEKTDPAGYICEASVPWSTLGTTPGLGDFIGVNVGVNDDDDGGGRDCQVTWLVTSGDQWQNPSLFPTMELIAAAPRHKSRDPYPADGATDVLRDVVLSWTPGIFAPPTNGHKVYLSENFNDVNDGIGGITQDANSYAPPQRLDLGTTYYWRVDEVNGAPDYTVHEGDVWSFTTEPAGCPIENIIATASSAHAADMGPENTINGSGLDENDLHSIEETTMWLSSTEPLGAWIQYEFDKVYKMHEMWVWNSNQVIEPLLGFGLKDVTIEYSTDGTDYTTLGTTHQFSQAPGAPSYAHNTTIDFGGVGAKYIRLTANSNWGGMLTQYGLCEVRFFYIPVRAREPNPDSGATDVSIGTINKPTDVTLGFRSGREAATHNVYFSTEEQAVIDGTAPVTTVSQAQHGPLSLDLGQTYYWRVDEVNEAETPATWQGDLWNFTTQEYFVVDDIESYNDLDPGDLDSNRIFLTWIDGYEVPTNGSLVGYENPPFCERTIVHGGKQSMPLSYSNTAGAAYSEAERTFAVGQNWTQAGAATLVLYFHGTEGNAGQLYMKVNDSKVVYDGDAGDIAKPQWKQWNIDLASLGVNLQSITKLSIGIDGIGASGLLYVDGIRLYRLAP